MRALPEFRVNANNVRAISRDVNRVAVVLPLDIFTNFEHDAVVVASSVIVPAASAGNLAVVKGHAFDFVVRGKVANADPCRRRASSVNGG